MVVAFIVYAYPDESLEPTLRMVIEDDVICIVEVERFLFCYQMPAIRISMTTDVVGEELEFTTEVDDYPVLGILYKPEGFDVYLVVMFLHGDGAADRISNGHHTTVMNAFWKT